MTPGTHRIGRLVLALDAVEAGDLAQLSAHLQAGLTDRIGAALAPVLDRLEPQGDVIRLDRLELDLGRIAADGADLPDKLAAALARALGAGIAASTGAARQATAGAEDPPGGRLTPPEGMGVTPHEDLLALFLRTGFLPPPLEGDALAPLCDALMALSIAAREQVRLRLRSVLRDASVRRRAVLQLPAGLVVALLDVAHPLRGALNGDRIDPQAVLPAFWQARMLSALADGAAMRPPGTAPPAGTAEDDRAALPLTPSAAAPPVPSSDADALPDLPDRIAVPTAGLVLLAPYLGAYAEALGLAARGRFLSPDRQARAVLLTHALATGRGEAMEPDLALPKLLCGCDLTAPVPRAIDLTEQERTEADTLLRAVIAHWGALGATTPDGLRDGFLCRPGVLDRAPGGGFRLRVERRGLDILLERLPWTLSMLRTPFMAAPLQVDWR